MDNIDLAYLAGLFDGEGCIYVVKMKVSGRIGYSLKLEMGQRQDNNDILYYIQSKLGGNVRSRKPTFYSNRYTRWSIHGDQAIGVLKQLLPYLKIKKLQAEIAITYDNNASSSDKEAIRFKLQELKAYKGA